MASPAHRRGTPCPICGGSCTRCPDLPTDPVNPFLRGPEMPDTGYEDDKPKRPKGKRTPAEDRARRPDEDRT